MASNDDIEFTEFANQFKNPTNISTEQSQYLVSSELDSELDPLIRRYENKVIVKASKKEIAKLTSYQIEFQKFAKSIGYNINPKSDIKSLSKLGVYLHHIKNVSGAVFVYDLILKEYPEDVRSLNNKSICFNNKDELPYAIRLADQAIKIYPDYFEPHMNKANFLLDMGNTDGFSILQSLLSRYPKHERIILLSLVDGYSRRGDWKQFLIYYRKAEEKGLVDTSFELRLAAAQFSKEKYKESLDTYEKILLKEPHNYIASINRVSCLIQLNYNHTALCVLRPLRKIYPKDSAFLAHLAWIHYVFNKPDLAIVLALKSIENGNDDYIIFNHLGLFYSALGDYEEGIRYYDKALSIKKDCYIALGNKSNNLNFQRKLSEAIDVMKTFDKYRPNEPIILNNIKVIEQEIVKRSNWPEEFQ